MIIPKDATPMRVEQDGVLWTQVAAMRGGLSRRDVGIAVVVAGLGALTLAFT